MVCGGGSRSVRRRQPWRAAASAVACGGASACAVAHKPAKHDDGAKVFGVGFKKTGTTTLDRILRRLAPRASAPGGAARRAAVRALLGPERDPAPALAAADRHRLFQDAPWCAAFAVPALGGRPLYQALATRHAAAKFVLTVRAPAAWWASVDAWLRCSARKQANELPARYARLLGVDAYERDAMVAAYTAHNAAVVSYFRDELAQPERLLVVDFATAADSWTPFCAFLEYWEACPTGGLPHRNENRRRAANGTDECGEMGDVD